MTSELRTLVTLSLLLYVACSARAGEKCHDAPDDHGRFSFYSLPVSHGTRCRVECDIGYGTQTERDYYVTTCTDGSWTHTQLCQPREKCHDAPDDHGWIWDAPPEDHGVLNCSQPAPHGSLCWLDCDVGYGTETSYFYSTTCTDGSWTVTQLCQPREKCHAAPGDHGSLDWCSLPVSHGGRCFFDCDDGYATETDDYYYTKCIDGNWTLAQLCQPRGTCHAAPDDHGALSWYSCPLPASPGSRCWVACDEDYGTENSHGYYTTCTGGSWTDTLLCRPREKCHAAPDDHGALPSWCPLPVSHRSQCRVHCDDGYSTQTDGYYYTTCNDGNWTHTQLCQLLE